MKINYEKIKNKAIVTLDCYNTHQIALAFVYDGKLPITKDYIFSKDMKKYHKWCNFLDKIYRQQRQFWEKFAIVLDPSTPGGCRYGDIDELTKEGYEAISITEALEELPNMCDILGVTPNQTLEEVGLLESDNFSPHRITLDGVIRSINEGCLLPSTVLKLMVKSGFLTSDNNRLCELLGLTSGEQFKIDGYIYEGFSSDDELGDFLSICEKNVGLFYEVINNPNMIIKIEDLEKKTNKERNLKNNKM